MAFSGLGSNGGGGRGRRRFGGGSLSEMNVVPLVDVVLVLLIIFMLTASAMEFGFDVEVPTVRNTQTTAAEVSAVVAIDRAGKYYLNDKPIRNLRTIGDEVRERFPNAKEVFFRADKSITYEQVAQVISELGASQLKVNMVAKAEDIRAKK